MSILEILVGICAILLLFTFVVFLYCAMIINKYFEDD